MGIVAPSLIHWGGDGATPLHRGHHFHTDYTRRTKDTAWALVLTGMWGGGCARAADMDPTATLMAAEPPGGGVGPPTHMPTLWLFARACSLTTF